MNKIRLGSKTKHVIEVNDNGDTITLDFANPSLISDAQEMIKKVEALEGNFAKLGDYFANSDINPLSKEGLEAGALLKGYYSDTREAVDIFLGDGACQKIFGDDNYYEMFQELFEVLQPQLDEIGIKASKHFQDIRSKYVPQAKKPKVI